MTDEEISRALVNLIREDAQRPSEDQIRDLIEAGVIDEKGRVLIGSGNVPRQPGKTTHQNGKNDPPSARRTAARENRKSP
jgi:hypothetical protein